MKQKAKNQKQGIKQELTDRVITNQEYRPIVMFALFAVIFLVSPYFRGLFFYENFYWMHIAIQVLFISIVALYFNQFTELLNKQKGILLILAGIILTYLISIWGSASSYLAVNEMLQWFTYATVFLFIIFSLHLQASLVKWVWYLCWATISWITLFVFIIDFGILEFRDAIIWDRFASVFQYPNTFAAIVSAFLLSGLFMLTFERSRIYQALYAIMLVPMSVAFLFTGSRGGLLVFIVGWVLGLLLLKWKQQLAYITVSILLAICTLAIYATYQSLIAEGNSIMAFLTLLASSLVFTAIVIAGHQYLHKLIKEEQDQRDDTYRKSDFILPGIALASITIGSLLFQQLINIIAKFAPNALESRMAGITLAEHSIQERVLFFKDSYAIWIEHFLIGTGGGGWRALFESYKSLPYHSTQAHSFFMQTLVEVGALGAVFVFSFIAIVLFKGVRTYYNPEQPSHRYILGPAIITVVAMLLHSAIDFNMSYGTYNLFLFVLLAVIWNFVNPIEFLSIKSLQNIAFRRKLEIGIKGFAILLLVVSAFSAYKAFAFSSAYKMLDKLQGQVNLYEAIELADQAISLDPRLINLRLAKTDILLQGYLQTQDQQMLEEIEQEFQKVFQHEPHLFGQYVKYGAFLWNIEQYRESMQNYKKAVELAPWQTRPYLVYIELQMHLWNIAQEPTSEQISQLSQVLKQLDDQLIIQNGPIPEGLQLRNPILLANEEYLIIARAYYQIGENEKSISYIDRINATQIEEVELFQMYLLKALNYHYMKDDEQLAEYLQQEDKQQLNLEQIFNDVLNDNSWRPVVENL